MIFGNPDKFAIYIDEVKDWSYPDFKEGIFAYIIKNQIIPNNCFGISSTLSSYWSELILHYNSNQDLSRENQYIFELDDIEAYNLLDKMRFSDVDNSQAWTYSLLVGDMIDDSNEVYLVTFNDKEKIFFKAKDTGFITCLELSKGTIDKVLLDTYHWCLDNLK
ncbi:Imm42 family immunity protein [Psychrobacter sp. I-STPA10]|uniref:Imm42 family immunity protein n=1 Tax=Psychrobacter sp. I-STPA10 TaxID=2585769 RepID=UPI001E29D299|nr:Imm42 family immunity protein [Psychrobacter sp. I-STPA10]